MRANAHKTTSVKNNFDYVTKINLSQVFLLKPLKDTKEIDSTK